MVCDVLLAFTGTIHVTAAGGERIAHHQTGAGESPAVGVFHGKHSQPEIKIIRHRQVVENKLSAACQMSAHLRQWWLFAVAGERMWLAGVEVVSLERMPPRWDGGRLGRASQAATIQPAAGLTWISSGG